MAINRRRISKDFNQAVSKISDDSKEANPENNTVANRLENVYPNMKLGDLTEHVNLLYSILNLI